MGRAYLSGLQVALHRWPLLPILLLTAVLAGLSFSAICWQWLSLALDKSLATRTLLRDLDMNVFIDLFIHHRESLYMLLLCGVLLLVVFWFMWICLTGAVVVAVSESDRRLGECLRRGLELYPAYVRLALLSALVTVGVVALAFFVTRGLTRWTAESPSEMTYYWMVALGVGLAGVLLLFFSTVHDHARIRSAVVGTGAAAAYLWAMRYVGGGEWRALPLAVLLLTNAFAAWVAYQTIGMLIATNSASGVVVSLLWGQLLLVVRMLLRVWAFAAQAALQELTEARS